jgi:hypothetical protein
VSAPCVALETPRRSTSRSAPITWKKRTHRPSAPISASEPGALRTCACVCGAHVLEPRTAEGSEANPEVEHVAERADHVEEAHTSPVRPRLRLRTGRAAHVRRARARAARGGEQRGEPRVASETQRSSSRSALIKGRRACIAHPPPSPPPSRALCARARARVLRRARQRAARRTAAHPDAVGGGLRDVQRCVVSLSSLVGDEHGRSAAEARHCARGELNPRLPLRPPSNRVGGSASLLYGDPEHTIG